MNERLTPLAAIALLAATFGACASSGTRLVSSWRDPSAGPLQFKKVLVLCIAPHQSQREFGERELVRRMKRTQGVAAHSVMSQDEMGNETQMRAMMAREGFDGAVAMRVVGSDLQLTSRPGDFAPAYSGFWSYYSVAWPLVYDQGYVTMDRRMQMETLVYSLKEDKLVWSGVSESMNPDSALELVDGVARTVGAELRKQRLIE